MYVFEPFGISTGGLLLDDEDVLELEVDTVEEDVVVVEDLVDDVEVAEDFEDDVVVDEVLDISELEELLSAAEVLVDDELCELSGELTELLCSGIDEAAGISSPLDAPLEEGSVSPEDTGSSIIPFHSELCMLLETLSDEL